MPVHSAWNQTGWSDLVVLVLKCLVAAALIAHAHDAARTTPDPAPTVQGSLLPQDQYAHSIPDTVRVILHTAWAAGGYVLVSSLFGLVGRALRWAPAYSIYYCANVFGLSVCLLACALPTVWAVARDGYCLTVERACLALTDPAGATCPYTIAAAAGAAAAAAGITPGKGAPEAGGAAVRGRLLLVEERWLAAVGENSSPCCYGPDFVRVCSEFLGDAYAQAVIACVLTALVLTQSVISCFYLCCDCDREWDSAPRPPPAPKVNLRRLSSLLAMRGTNGGDGDGEEQPPPGDGGEGAMPGISEEGGTGAGHEEA